MKRKNNKIIKIKIMKNQNHIKHFIMMKINIQVVLQMKYIIIMIN